MFADMPLACLRTCRWHVPTYEPTHPCTNNMPLVSNKIPTHSKWIVLRTCRWHVPTQTARSLNNRPKANSQQPMAPLNSPDMPLACPYAYHLFSEPTANGQWLTANSRSFPGHADGMSLRMPSVLFTNCQRPMANSQQLPSSPAIPLACPDAFPLFSEPTAKGPWAIA